MLCWSSLCLVWKPAAKEDPAKQEPGFHLRLKMSDGAICREGRLLETPKSFISNRPNKPETGGEALPALLQPPAGEEGCDGRRDAWALLSPAGDDGRRRRRGLYLEMEGCQECGRASRHTASEESSCSQLNLTMRVRMPFKFSLQSLLLLLLLLVTPAETSSSPCDKTN